MVDDKGVSIAFEACFAGPPKLKLYIWKELPLPNDAPDYMVSGWGFSVSEFGDNGKESPLWDTWEETYEEILRYPAVYAPREIVWINSITGEEVDIYNL